MTKEQRVLTAYKKCEKLWAWLAETGEKKSAWPGWKEKGNSKAATWMCCFYCYLYCRLDCEGCPFKTKFGHCHSKKSPYDKWSRMTYPPSSTKEERIKQAKLVWRFVKQARETLEKQKGEKS